MACCSFPGGSESPAAPGLTSPIVTGARVAAAGLLFLVAFVFFRETRATGREFLKPTVWVSPSRVVALGGSVTIRCEGSYPGWEFFLRKAGHPDRQLQTVPDGTVAEFPIPSVGWEDGGTYTCDYCSITDQNRCSYPSDPVEIIVGEPSYPKPSISLSPSGGVSLGGAVSVWCWGQRQGVRFVLNKEGRRFPAVDSSGSGAVFFISNTLHPTEVTAPGADVTIRCRGQPRDVRFFLHKAGDLNPPRHMDPAGDGAEFHIPTVGRQHGGSYGCSYRPRSEPFVSSQPSHPVQLVVAEGSYPKPSISVSSGGVIPVGGNVTIRCRHQRLGMRILLYKAGKEKYVNYTDPAGSEAEFPIPSTRREHGGSYTCRYSHTTGSAAYSEPSDPVQIIVTDLSSPKLSITLSPSGEGARVRAGVTFPIPKVSQAEGGSYTCYYPPDSDPKTWVEPSDPVELVVADPSLPRPSISLSPTGVTAPGADVTIRCRGQPRDVRFFLHKAGDLNPPRHMDPAGDGAEFHIPTVGRQHGGSYGCSYQPRSEPFVSSQPSHPVQLVVAGPALLTSHIIPGVSAAAAVLLLLPLLVAFVCFRKTRARKGAAPRPSSTSPMGALKTSAQQGPVYASIDEGKEPQTLEPDPGADEVTYAELDGQALQAKRGALAPAPEPAQPSMYAAINVSSGPASHLLLLVSRLQKLALSKEGSGRYDEGWDTLSQKKGATGWRESPYSKPSISLSPSGEIAPGTDVSISCHGPRQGMRFKMYRAGVARWHMEPAGLTAEFHIPNVRREDGGTYTCSYESLGEPPVSSPRSDPVELVAAVHFSKPSISLSPSGEIAPGTDVSISCHGPRLGMRFKMYRAGVARWHTEPAGLRAEFHIPNVRREDGGTYTCSYESLGEPPVSSPHSDPVELVVAGAPPRQDYTPFAIVRLSLAVGVLLALVLILAEAAYSWKRAPPRRLGFFTLAVATVQEETRSYPCEAGAPSHRIDLPPDAGEGDRKMQWVYGNTTIATYPPSQHLPSVLDVGEWGISVTSCINLTLLVFDATGKERRTHYTASPGNLLVRNQSDGQRSDPSGAWRQPPGNSGGFGATLLISLLTRYLLS
ncbi:unnamed protein product [Caretta caretta]